MGRMNVKCGDKWACLSSIVESLITPFMSLENYEAWRKEEYGRAGYQPMKERNTIDIKDAVHTMRLNHTGDEVFRTLVECGLSEDESKILLEAEHAEHYRPALVDGRYICPNCGGVVEHMQEVCHIECCCLAFEW